MSSQLLPHIFLTRFNVPTNRVEKAIFSDDWLQHRMTLFNRYTVPSVKALDGEAIHWVIYLDDRSPAWLVEEMERLSRQVSLLPRYIDSALTPEAIAADIATVCGSGGRVITSNLDNDDGLSVDFVARLRAAAPAEESAGLCLVNGLILSQGRLYLRRDPSNPFTAVSDDLASPDFVSCWSRRHNALREVMPVSELAGTPAWLQVVHGRNVSNRVRGELQPASDYTNLFAGLIDDLPDPSPGTLRLERLVRQPSRALREAGVAKGLQVSRKVMGDSGVERMKLLLKRAR